MKLALGYVGLCLIAEVFSVLGLFLPGALIHGLLILGVFSYFGLKRQDSQAKLPRLPLALALVSLMRFISLALPLELVPPIARAAVIALPLWIAVVLIAWRLGLTARQMGLGLQAAPKQVWIALSGIPLGVEGYIILRPPGLLPEASVAELVLGSLLLMVGVGITEELLFRGLLLTVAESEHGQRGLILGSVLFGVMVIGSGSPAYALFMALVGWFFSECASRTGSLWGVALAHTLMVISMSLFWPALF
jgi:membrane protease YdiL (CAAX protease family)